MRRIFGQYSVYSTHPTDTVTNRRRPAIYAAPTPVPYPTSVCHDDQQGSRSETAAFWSSAGRNSFYPRTSRRRVVGIPATSDFFCTEWSDCKRRLHRSVVMLILIYVCRMYCTLLPYSLQRSVVDELPVAALFDVQR